MKFDVRRVARLARLTVGDDELEGLSRDMEAIVEMVSQLPKGGGSDLDLCANANVGLAAVALPTALREDAIEPSLPREDVLQNAPSEKGGFVVAPQIML